MSYINPNTNGSGGKSRIYKRRWFKIVAAIIVVVAIVGGIFLWKTDSILKKMTSGGIISSLVHNIPGVDNQLKGEADGRINILLLGMRGANDPAGGTLADTIMLLSIDQKDNKAALLSIPRDLFVDNPATGSKTKINAVYAYGEKKGKGQGMANMEQEVGAITGLPIHYTAVINFDGFKKIIDILGGVTITLDKPFEESVQFNQPQVCDGITFTVPTGEFEQKTAKVYWPGTRTVKRLRVTASYPLCTNAHPECNGDFKLSAGTHTLDSTDALCYARSRETSNDFQRAARQQQVLQAVKDKLLNVGTLADFSKMNQLIENLGDNFTTDMQPWEIKRLYDIYTKMKDFQLYQRVIDATNDPEVGLVYGQKDPVAGDILLPKGNNFDKIKELFQNIFTLDPQHKETATSFSTTDTSAAPASTSTPKAPAASATK